MTWVGVVESYRPGSGAHPKQRTIKSFGYLEDQPDPVTFMAEVEHFNATYKEQNIPLRIEAEGTARMYSEENRKQNYGYKFLEAIYDSLSIDSFIEGIIEDKWFPRRILTVKNIQISCTSKDTVPRFKKGVVSNER